MRDNRRYDDSMRTPPQASLPAQGATMLYTSILCSHMCNKELSPLISDPALYVHTPVLGDNR